MRRFQLGLLIALSLGMTGCQTSGNSSWSPSTWSWNPWASKDTAVAKSDSKGPALPSETAKDPKSTAVATRTTTPPAYPTTSAPPANFGAPQQGAYPTTNAYAAQPNAGYPTTPAAGYPMPPANGYPTTQPAPAYGAQPAYGSTSATGNPNATVPAGYMGTGMGGYGQPATATTPAAPGGYGMSPTAYGAAAPAYGTTPANTTPTAYGQQPYPGSNPYAQPPAQPGATPGYGQGASYDASNPSSAFASGNFTQAAASAPARNTAAYMPGSIKPMTGTSSGVTQAGFELKPSDTTAAAANAYGSTAAGSNCENGICYPNGSTTTATPAGYQQPTTAQGGYGTPNPAPAASSSPSFYR